MKISFKKKDIKNRNIQIYLLRHLLEILPIFIIPIIGKFNFYNFLELYLLSILCKNQNYIFNDFFQCFQGKHIIYFFFSCICLILVFFINHVFIIFSFKKNENKVSSLIKNLIIDRQKIFYYTKIYLSFLETIAYDYNIKSFLSLSFFICSLINFLFCYKEISFRRNLRNEDLIRFYLFTVNFISNSLLFFYYLFNNNKKIKGIFYIFFVFSFILIGIVIFSKNQFYILKHKNIFNLKEIDIYIQLSMLIDSIKEKKTNRKQFLNLISYFSIELEKNIQEIENLNFFDESKEKKNDYILYLYIENIYKKKTELFSNSILLKMTYSDFLYNIIKKYKKSYQTLYQLYSDIENNKIFSTIQEEFYVYRIKREIEERSINNINDGSDISFQYQSHSLMKIISQIAEVYYNFWNLLLTSNQKEDLNKLDEYTNQIIKLKKDIDEKFEAISSSNQLNKKITEYYILYLREIIKDNEKADNILTEKLEKYKNDFSNDNSNNNIYNIENLFPSSHFQFIIISLDKNNFGNILKISSDISGKIGYSSEELIGHNLNILMPNFLKEEHNKILKKIIKEGNFFDENQKMNKLCVFIKTKSKFLKQLPLDIKILCDEDRNPFIFAKLNQDLDILFSKEIREKFYIMVNQRFFIKYCTPNCLKSLNLNTKIINGNYSIFIYIKELYSEITKIILESEDNINKRKIQYSILKDSYMTEYLEQKITWNKNNKYFYMNCREIKMNDKIMGFIFQFEECKDYFSSVISNVSYNNLRRESQEQSKLNFNIGKRNSLRAEDLNNIKGNYLPPINEEIEFDYKNKKYIFKQKYNDSLNIQTVKDYYESEILNRKKQRFKKKQTINEESSSFSINSRQSKEDIFISEEEEEEEEEDDELEEEEEEEESITKSNNSYKDNYNNNDNNNNNDNKYRNLNNIIKNTNEPKNSIVDFYKLMENSKDNIYRVKLSNITLYIYNFKTSTFIEYKKIYNTSKFDERLGNEFSMSNRLNREKLKRRRNPLNKIMKLTFSKLFILPKLKKLKQKEIIRNTNEINKYISQKKCNFSIKLLLISLIFFFLIITILYIYFFQNVLSLRKDIEKIARINRYLSDLRDNTNDIFYQSFQLAIINNPRYSNLISSRENLKKNAKNKLLKLYQDNLLLIQELEDYQESLTEKYQEKINYYSVDFVAISKNLYINTTQKKIINLFSEFTFSVYNYATSNDNNINLRNLDYNFILYNAKIFYSDRFEDYLNSYLNVYKEKNKIAIFNNYIFTIVFLVLGILIFFILYKSNKKVILDKEKILKLFFQIEVSSIKKSISKCEKFMDKEKNWSSYSNEKSVSEKNENDGNESKENENLLRLDSQIINLINKKASNKKKKKKHSNKIENNKVIIQEKGKNNIIIVLLIQLIILFIILLSISIYINNLYSSFYRYTSIYFLIQTHKTFYSKYFNYVRMFIIYYHKSDTDPMAYFISKTLKQNLKLLMINNEQYLEEILKYIKKYSLPKSSLKLLSSVLKDNLCEYSENEFKIYNISCDSIGDGVIKTGLFNTLNYGIHSIYYLMKKIAYDIKVSEKKGYKYNEINYGIEEYYNLYPQNTNQWEEYEKLNPFNSINDHLTKDLTIIVEIVIKNTTYVLIDSIKKEIINGFNFIKHFLICLCIFFGFFLYYPIFFYFIPDIILKNNDINRKRKLLGIIPKDILVNILYQNDDL